MNVACILVLLVMLMCFVNALRLPVTCRTPEGKRLLDGEHWRDPKRCSIYSCANVDGAAQLMRLKCGVTRVPHGCRVVHGDGKLYPGCCPTVICST
uniref:Toxin protein n=1 Tax=Hemiscorpius lepturus TaxID=520031 RepID=A0A1L4BJ51_HEMLE|nr:toxin protein [Hemiscorpius lepturus]